MNRDPHILSKFLYEHPQAWPVRMALIEEMIRDGEVERAKALVRESPNDSPMPPEYPQRIHALMTQGSQALDSLPELPGFRKRTDFKKGQSADVSGSNAGPSSGNEPPAAEADGNGGRAALAENDPQEKPDFQKAKGEAITPLDDAPAHHLAEPSFAFSARASSLGEDGKLTVADPEVKGGLAALAESTEIRRQKLPKPPPPGIDPKISAIRWENYAGKLHLTGGELPDGVAEESQTGDRFSAFSVAVILHLLVALLISFVFIQIPRPNPPKLIVSMPDENVTDDLVVHRLTKPADKKPSAAAAQAVNVATTISISDFALPEVEDTTSLDVTAMIDGIAAVGAGMSISSNVHQESDVNFFGIASGGKRIVFVIDATPKMLVDEKGGMFAYDKVKSELASMLIHLNRGTKFNILLYEGRRVLAFREDLVPGLPSNIRLAVEWLDPLNRNYDNLGLLRGFGEPIEVAGHDGLPIAPMDVAHYTKCIQKAMEWQAAVVFCIVSGYERMARSPTPEMRKKMMEENLKPGTPGKVDPKEQAAWERAVAKTREWLRKENEARREKGLAPKVVINFRKLVEEITGAKPPRPTGEVPGERSRIPPLPPVNFDDIDVHLRKLVIEHYRERDRDSPSVHMVVFLGEDEDFPDADKDHFRRIVRRNNGKLKILRGLAALDDVTAK